ncbi:MAG TPA: CHAT domain-containing tetratricopeptide repeat protein [Pyrinomonadaceae bacterium]
MRFVTSSLALALVASLVLSGGRVTRVAAAPQTSGASSEREQGRTLLRRGRAAEALVHLENALKAFKQSGNKSGEASTQDLLGELFERQGRYDLAQQHYVTAQNLYAASVKRGKSPAVPGGKLQEASKAVSTATELSNEENVYNARLLIAKVGHMLYRRGNFAGARAEYMKINVSKPDTSAKGKAKRAKGWGGIAGSVLGSDNDAASVAGAVAGAAIGVKDQLDFYRDSIIYAGQELGLGRVEYQQGQFDAARKHFENVLEATKGDVPGIGKLGQTRRFRAAARTSLGDVAFKSGNYKDAAEAYEKAAKGARDDKRDDLMWPAQRGLGRSLWQQAEAEKDRKKADKLREKALDSYRDALATVEKLRQGGVRADESRTTFLATTAEVFEEAAAALAEMALATQAAGAPLEGQALAYASEALSVVERGRSRSLLDMLGESGAEITAGVPAALLNERRENQRRQEEIAAELTGVSLGGSGKKKSLEDLEEELSELQEKFDSIENRIRTADPRYEQLTATRPLALEDIRARVLDDETALLEYSLGEPRSYLFAVTRGGFTVSRLPGRAELGRQVSDFRQQVVPASARRSITDLVAAAVDPQRGLKVAAAAPVSNPAAVRAYAEAAHALYKSAVEPAAPLFKSSRLLVVADGALNYVPFHALVNAQPPDGADFSTLPYLLKTNETVFAPSASVVAAVRRQREATTQASGMLIVADPVFDSSDTRAGAANSRQGAPDAGRAPGFDSALADVAGGAQVPALETGARRVALVRLTGTREEAQQIAKLAADAGRKADVWLDLAANEGELETRDLRQYRVLHFATHGLLNAERPQFTGVVLSLVGNGAGSDGFLRTDEVFNLRLGSPLVMLSACETGLGREKRGEGVMGLTRAFMYAGAPTVGVSLWPVADRSTAELMTDFYKNYLGAQPSAPASAMHSARLSMIAGKKYSAPFYWAPFVLVGDWK